MADYISRYTGEEIDERLAAVPDKYTMPAGGIPSTDLAEDVQTSLGKADSAIQSLAPVTDLIPAAASTTNQLADKAFVNSSVATNTANYISDNGEPFASLAALEAYSGPLTNNDYAFVVGTDSAGNATYTRYKYTASTDSWAEEYVLNNSSFTAEQWAAISSGITSADVTKIGNAVLVTEQSLTTEQKTQARTNIGAGTYSKPSGGIPSSDLASGVIPAEIDTVNVTVDNNIGTPSATGSVSGSTLSLAFQNLKGATGATGATGPQGPAAPQPFKGLYPSSSALASAWPNPQTGDYAYVQASGTPASATIYAASSGSWADTGIAVGVTDMESVFPLAAKLALIAALEKVAWIDAYGQTYVDTLRSALLGTVELVSISAVFNSGGTVILDTMSIDELKNYLTVTAEFSDGTQETVTGYVLTGSMTAGQETFTVSYQDKTDTFDVTVKHNYAGALSTWALHQTATGGSGVAEYVDGYIRMKCVNSAAQSGYGVWCADAAKSTWGEVNGKTLKFRLKINTYSSDVAIFGVAAYNSTSPTSLGATSSRKQGFADTMIDAGGGWYEKVITVNVNDFTSGTYTPTSSSAFGLYGYARALNDYIEIYDLQIFEVESV